MESQGFRFLALGSASVALLAFAGASRLGAAEERQKPAPPPAARERKPGDSERAKEIEKIRAEISKLNARLAELVGRGPDARRPGADAVPARPGRPPGAREGARPNPP